MPDAPGDYLVTLVQGAERRRWCDRCNTSAILEWDVYAFSEGVDTVDTVGGPVATIGGCTRCDPDKFAD